jgi:hypothetical protein
MNTKKVLFNMALVNRNFTDIITFTRSTTGTYFDSAGVMRTAAINEARLDYDPVTLQPRGLLVEEQRTRLNTVSTGSALLSPTRAAYVDDGSLFIDGVTPFKKLVEDTATGSHIGVPASVAVAANTSYTAQYVVKASGRTKFSLEAVTAVSWSPTSPRVIYDLVAMTASGSSGATGTIKAIGGDRYRVTWTAMTGAAGFSTAVYAFLLNSAGVASYTGDGVSGIYISGYQLEAGSFATSLIVGEGSQVTRSADIPSVNTLSPWYNASEGSWQARAQGIVGQALLTAGTAVITADSAAVKDYELSYSTDQSASSVVIGKGHIESVKYYPRAIA